MSFLRFLTLLLIAMALSAADPLTVDLTAGLPAALKPGPGWSLGADPAGTDRRTVWIDARGLAPSSGLQLVDPRLAGDWLLSFKARYATPFPGMGGGGKPNGHWPLWHLSLGGGAEIEDTFAWNGLLYQQDGKPVTRLDGSRPRERWVQWQLAKSGNSLEVWIDGFRRLRATLPAAAGHELTWQAMHLQLWLSDLRLEDWHQLVAAGGDGRDPDRSESADFDHGGLPAGWRTNGGWDDAAADPDHPGNRVLHAAAEHMRAEVLSGRMNYSDYHLSYRVRFATAWKPFPQSDNLHFPHWQTILRAPAEGGQMMWSDEAIWGAQFLTWNGKNSASGSRSIVRDRWQQIDIIASHDRYRVTVDGKPAIAGQTPDVPHGAIGFAVMDGELWLDDIRLVPYPTAELYETFVDGLNAARWQSGGWTVTDATEGNRCAVAGASTANNWLTHRHDRATALLACRVSPTTAGGAWEWCLAGDPAGRWLGLRAAAGKLELGIADGTTWKALASGSAAIPPGAWTALRADRAARTVIVRCAGVEVLNAPVPDDAPAGGSVAWRDAGAGLRLDDVLIDELPAPSVAIQPLAASGVFIPGEDHGLALSLRNDDEIAHTGTAELVTRDSAGTECGRASWSAQVPPGGRIDGARIVTPLPTPGRYTFALTVAWDGRQVEQRTRPVDLLPAPPIYSPAYPSRFGMVGSDAQLLSRLGAAWSRGGGAFTNYDGKDFTAAEHALAPQLAAGLRTTDLCMLGGRGHTLEGIHDMAAEFAATAAHFAGRPGISLVVWNEPNHGAFWRFSPINAWDYEAVAEASWKAAKRADPRTEIMVGETSGADDGFIAELLAAGAGNRMDVLTYHPYGYPVPPERLIGQAVAKIEAVADRYTAWLPHQHTEHGYPTTTNNVGVSEEVQSQFMVRTQLLVNGLDRVRAHHFYQLWDCGDNPDDVEHRFGLLHTNQETKPSYIALATMARQVANCALLGRLPTDDGTWVQVYRRRDGATVLAAWSFPEPRSITLALGGGSFTACDEYGKALTVPVHGGTATLAFDGAVRYLVGDLDPALVVAALRASVTERLVRATGRLATMPEARRAALATSLASAGQTIDAALGQASGASRDAAVRAACDVLGTAVDGVLANAKELGELPAALLAEDCQHLLACAGQALVSPGADPGPAIAAAETSIAQHRPGHQALTISERMLAWAVDRAARAHADPQAAAAPGLRELAVRTAQMATRFATVETPFDPWTSANVLPKNFALASGGNASCTTVIENGPDAAAEVTITWQPPTGWPASAPLKRRVEANATWQDRLEFAVPADAATGSYAGTMLVTRDGKPWKAIPVKLTVAPPAAMHLLPIAGALRDARSVRLVVDGQHDGVLAGTVTLSDAGGSELGKAPVNLSGKSRAELTLPLRVPAATPFNDYRLSAALSDAAGQPLLAAQLPLDIPRVRRAKQPPTIDGTLDEWTEAYAVHLQFGADPARAADLSGTAWAMWDERCLYLALKIRDDLHWQPSTGGNMWGADCVQIGLDPKHHRSEGYSPDDWELGAALGNDGKISTAQWVGPSKDLMAAAQVAIRRDEAAKLTIYELALPRDRLGLPATAGAQFGMNLGINDADGIPDHPKGRSGTIQCTSGTIDAKNPATYWTWTLTDD